MTAYLKPETNTELANDAKRIARNMRSLQEDIIHFNDVAGQIKLDGTQRLADLLGFQNTADALALTDVLGSVEGELLNAPFFQQTISRVG